MFSIAGDGGGVRAGSWELLRELAISDKRGLSTELLISGSSSSFSHCSPRRLTAPVSLLLLGGMGAVIGRGRGSPH